MKNLIKVIVIILSLLLLGIDSVQAGDLLEISFQNEPGPMFQNTNFLPGDEVSAWVKVRNISSERQKIGVEIIDRLEPPCQEYCLADQLNLIITEGKDGVPLVMGPLSTFYKNGETYLSDVEPGEEKTYYFFIHFAPEASNSYQGLSAKFDIKIGAFGKESISGEVISGGGNGGGGIFIGGLQIFNESASEISENSATITWQTNLESTSRVIYSPEGAPHLLKPDEPPNYGYLFSTPEDPKKVTYHTVTIEGLLPGTTYYFRCVSHASPPTISREFTFTTLSKEESKEEKEELVSSLPSPEEVAFKKKETPSSFSEEPLSSNRIQPQETLSQGLTQEKEETKRLSETKKEGEKKKEGISKKKFSWRDLLREKGLLATIAEVFFQLKYLLLIIALILALLILVSIKEREKRRKKE